MLVALFDRFNISVTRENHDNLDLRRFRQGFVYLSTICGIDSSYRHKWVREPWSDDLSEDIFRLAVGGAKNRGGTFKKEANESLKEIEKLTTSPPGLSKERWVELLSTIHYYRNICEVRNRGPDQIKNALRGINSSRKVYFEESPARKFYMLEFKKAWGRLKRSGLLNYKPDYW